jgi:hypothetical protein
MHDALLPGDPPDEHDVRPVRIDPVALMRLDTAITASALSIAVLSQKLEIA